MLNVLQTVAQPEPWWQHVLETFLAGTVPVIIWLINNRHRARKQMLAEQEKVKAEIERRHKENTTRMDNQDEKLDELLNERKYIPSHGHRESSGPLSAENIFPKR